MNDDAIQDLKQFISATVSQQLSVQTDEIRGDISEIRGDIKRLEKSINDVDQKTDAILEAVSDQHEETQSQIDAHGARITKLETKVA